MNTSGGNPSNSLPQDHDPEAAAIAEERELIARAQHGDAHAFGELCLRYRQRAFAMIYHMIRNEQDAWDLTQDGFLKAWKSIHKFREDSSFFTWLYRIMMNVSIDWTRRKRGTSAGEFNDAVALQEIEPAATTVPQGTTAPGAQLADREIRGRIEAALAQLSPEHRQVAILREIDGMEYSEIATVVGCSLGTVMSRLFYARKKLQTLLRDAYENL